MGDGAWQQSTSCNFVAGVLTFRLKTSLNESPLEEIWSQLQALFSHRSEFESLTHLLMRISWAVSRHLVYLFTGSVMSCISMFMIINFATDLLSKQSLSFHHHLSLTWWDCFSLWLMVPYVTVHNAVVFSPCVISALRDWCSGALVLSPCVHCTQADQLLKLQLSCWHLYQHHHADCLIDHWLAEPSLCCNSAQLCLIP